MRSSLKFLVQQVPTYTQSAFVSSSNYLTKRIYLCQQSYIEGEGLTTVEGTAGAAVADLLIKSMFVIAVGELYTGTTKPRHCARLITRRSERPYYVQDCITAQISALDVLVNREQLDAQRNASGLTTHNLSQKFCYVCNILLAVTACCIEVF